MFEFKYQGLEVNHQLVENPADAAGGEYFPHCHEDCVEVYIVMAGSAMMYVENSHMALENGLVAVMLPHELHHAEILGDAPFEYIDFKVPSVFVSEFITDRIKACGSFYRGRSGMVSLDRIDEFYVKYTEEGASDEMIYIGFGSWISAMLVFLCRKDAEAGSPESENTLVSNIKKYIDDNLVQKITMQDLCDHFYRSSSYISKQFRDVTGLPVMTYIRNRKMDVAEYLLSMNAKPADVAKDLGFTDYSSFYKAYLSVKGAPPKRKRLV